MKTSTQLNDLKEKIFRETGNAKYLDELNDIIGEVEKLEKFLSIEPTLIETEEALGSIAGTTINIGTINIYRDEKAKEHTAIIYEDEEGRVILENGKMKTEKNPAPIGGA